jgi:hypothetical protein
MRLAPAFWTPLLLCLLFVTPITLAAAEAGGNLAGLASFLDKTTPAPNRKAIFDVWMKSALAGDTDAQYLVGTLYRRGDAIVPHVVEADEEQARRYLSTAAAHGRLLAMAKMAEIELADDHPLEAMIWAQIYGAYRGWVNDERGYGPNNERQPTLYFEDLLRRASKRLAQKFGDDRTADVLAGLNQFVAQHDKEVRAQLVRDGLSPQWLGAPVPFENAKSMKRVGVDLRNTVSEWVLTFAADGSFASADVLDAIPVFIHANGHRSLVTQYRAAAVDKGTPERLTMKVVDLRKVDWPIGPVRTH